MLGFDIARMKHIFAIILAFFATAASSDITGVWAPAEDCPAWQGQRLNARGFQGPDIAIISRHQGQFIVYGSLRSARFGISPQAEPFFVSSHDYTVPLAEFQKFYPPPMPLARVRVLRGRFHDLSGEVPMRPNRHDHSLILTEGGELFVDIGLASSGEPTPIVDVSDEIALTRCATEIPDALREKFEHAVTVLSE